MLKIRFGGLPVIEVKMPVPPTTSVLWSSQYGKIV